MIGADEKDSEMIQMIGTDRNRQIENEQIGFKWVDRLINGRNQTGSHSEFLYCSAH